MTAARPAAVRIAVLLLGAVLAAVARLRRRRAPAAHAPASRCRATATGQNDGGNRPLPPSFGAIAVARDAEAEAAPPGRATQAVRGALLAVGVAGLGFGAWTLVATVSVKSLGGLAVWLAAAVVLHDAVLSPIVFVVARALRRAGRRLPGAALAVVQIGVVTGALLTLIVAPEIRAKALGPRNPSVLPFDYALRLGLLWAGIAVVVAVAVVVLTRARARSASRAARPAA